MFLIDFNKEFEPLPEEVEGSKPVFLKSILSFCLARTENARDAVKVWDWAMGVSKTGLIEADAADRKVLREIVSESKVLMVGAKAQILKTIDAAQEGK